MKKVRFYLKKIIVLIAVSFVFFSTEAQIRRDDVIKINLSLSQNYLELESSGGSKNITVTTNASSWTVSGNSDWCSVSKSGNLFTISSNANPNNYERNATFTVNANKETATVTVKQKAKPVETYKPPQQQQPKQQPSQQNKNTEKTELEKGEWRALISKVITNETKNYNIGKYKGEYKNSNRNGFGLYYWNDDKDSYWGNFSVGNINGQGIYIRGYKDDFTNCPNCKYYVGDWKNGDMHGQGKCYDKTGKLIYSGNFSDDKPTGTYPSNYNNDYKFECINFDEWYYVGETLNGKPHGQGIKLYKNNNKYSGDAVYTPTWDKGNIKGKVLFLNYDGTIKVVDN